MSGTREEQIGDARLILGDCRDLQAELPVAAAIVSDPPYGMAWDTDSKRFTGGARTIKRGDGRDDWGNIAGDGAAFDPEPWVRHRECILWGANHYAARLTVGTTLVWLKKAPHLYGTFLSDAEIGWQKGGHGVYCHFKSFPPPSRAHEGDGGHAAHPTQKPIQLMEWCIQRTSGAVVLDPFMGSGSTAIAALRLGRKFIGIEIEPRWFDVACRRIEAAYRQRDLFRYEPQVPKPVQQSLLGDAA